MTRATMAIGLGLIVAACAGGGSGGPTSSTRGEVVAVPSPTAIPRCPDGRPEAEIRAAGRLPVEVADAGIVCVLNASSQPPGHDRLYLLADRRQLHVYEYAGELPAKPGRTPIRSGEQPIARSEWRWTFYDGPPLLLLEGRIGGVTVMLDLPSDDLSHDLPNLTRIAAAMIGTTPTPGR